MVQSQSSPRAASGARALLRGATFACAALAAASPSMAQADGPALGTNRITQAEVVGGTLTLDDLRTAGMRMFATPFNRLDGYGDGPMNSLDPISFGGRPTLQNNGTFLRVNGLDAQTCMECHAVGSNDTVPFRFAVGGVGASNNNVLFQPRNIDVDDEVGNGFADFDGRYINPPFLFGSGGIELLGNEMTEDLQALKAAARNAPGTVVALTTHGVSFGTILFDAQTQTFDTSGVEGIEEDLVVRPFGRKGEFATVRAFDVDAMMFHFGMQPVEVVGAGIDDDGDTVVDEIGVGELSALHIFNTNLERPEIRDWNLEARRGLFHFVTVGCAECHIPAIETRSRQLDYRFPEVPEDPSQNVFYSVDLASSKAGFVARPAGGIEVQSFSDLKRHDMGPGLAENFGSHLDSHFITARLWGVADTAPYLHDGRATTITDAILAHGGEAQLARDQFDALPQASKVQLLTFLKRLKTPIDPAADILP